MDMDRQHTPDLQHAPAPRHAPDFHHPPDVRPTDVRLAGVRPRTSAPAFPSHPVRDPRPLPDAHRIRDAHPVRDVPAARAAHPVPDGHPVGDTRSPVRASQGVTRSGTPVSAVGSGTYDADARRTGVTPAAVAAGARPADGSARRLVLPVEPPAGPGYDAVGTSSEHGERIMACLPRVGCVFADDRRWWWIVPSGSHIGVEWPPGTTYLVGADLADPSWTGGRTPESGRPHLIHRPADDSPYTPPIPLYFLTCRLAGATPQWTPGATGRRGRQPEPPGPGEAPYGPPAPGTDPAVVP
ncbi:hypothetical protein OK074_6103 [Actinobacteria bacterium OK074]|nr:hypothetical protein OK074_6103 [Actinobacteria bacterium OK074]